MRSWGTKWVIVVNQSKIYLEISKQELQVIVTKHFGCRPFQFQILHGGMFNTTYLLTVNDNEKYILRLGPVNRHLLLPFENKLMISEPYFYNLCRQRKIPVPEIVAVDLEKKEIDRDYMITKYIASEPLSAETFSEEDKIALYRSVGFYALQINQITGDGFGRVADVVEGRGFCTWSAYLAHELEEWAQTVVPYRLYAEEEVERIRMLPRKYQQILNAIDKPYLVHADLWEGNILVERADGQYRVAAIIDGDRSLFGDPAFETASGWMINESFLKGYRLPISHDHDAWLRKQIYRLMYAVIDSYVWFVEYDNEENGNNTRAKARELLQTL